MFFIPCNRPVTAFLPTGGAVLCEACSVWTRNHTSARVKMQRLESAIEKATGLDLDNDGTVVELK